MARKNMKEIATEVGLDTIKCLCGRRTNGKAALEEFFVKIVEACRDGGEVRIKNFGTFSAKLYKGREIKSPALGNGQAKFEDTYVLRFHQSASAKKRLNKISSDAERKE